MPDTKALIEQAYEKGRRDALLTLASATRKILTPESLESLIAVLRAGGGLEAALLVESPREDATRRSPLVPEEWRKELEALIDRWFDEAHAGYTRAMEALTARYEERCDRFQAAATAKRTCAHELQKCLSALLTGVESPREHKQEQEQEKETRVAEGQQQRIERIGSTAASNELRVNNRTERR